MSATAVTREAIAPGTSKVQVATPAAQTRVGLWLGLLLLGTLLKGVFWIFLVFPFDANDEASHLDFVGQLLSNKSLPVVVMPNPDEVTTPPSTAQNPLFVQAATSFGYTRFFGSPYEASQPPLYYLVAALFAAPVAGSPLAVLYVARLVSALFGVGTVWALWWCARALWPDKPLLVWGAPLALTLQPQFSFITANVTNDAAVIFFGALLLVVWVAGLKAIYAATGPALWVWGLLAGAVTALGILSKLTMAVTLPCTLLWLGWLVYTRHKTTTARLATYGGAILAASASGLALLGWWLLRNMQVYGEPTGTRAIFNLYHTYSFDLVATNLAPGQFFSATLLIIGVSLIVRSFWAAFGPVTVMAPLWAYVPPLLLSMYAVLGGIRGWREKKSGAGLAPQSGVARLAGLMFFGAIANLIFFMLTVAFQPQGRYLFVALAPAILLIMLGLSKATPNEKLNRILMVSLPVAMLLLQIVSVPILLDRWAELASKLGGG